MKVLLGQLVLMCQVWKDSIKNYWSTGPNMATPIFPQSMGWNHYEAVWKAWYFSSNVKQTAVMQVF